LGAHEPRPFHRPPLAPPPSAGRSKPTEILGFQAVIRYFPHMQKRLAIVLSLGAFACALAGIADYHARVATGQFIPRPEMAALGMAVLFGTITVSATVVAAGRHLAWITSLPVVYRRQAFVNGPLAAFICGMLAYLVVYPPTPWVFDTMTSLAFGFGLLLMMPVDGTDGAVVVAALNALAGAAACVSGFASRNGVLIMLGAVVMAGGVIVSIVARAGAHRSLASVLFAAFSHHEA
jgi:NAD/NADP transhydrogenase beta subunit